MTRVGMTYDLRTDYLEEGYSEEQTAEFDQPATIDAIEETLGSLGYRTERIGHVRALAKRLVAGERWDLVFNIAEGLKGFGRESQVPCLLEAYDIPYVFSDPLVLSLTLHKAMAKRVIRDLGIPTPDFAVVEEPGDIADVRLPFPLFVKPANLGSSVGISRAQHADELAASIDLAVQFDRKVLVEAAVPIIEWELARIVARAEGAGEAQRMDVFREATAALAVALSVAARPAVLG